MAQEQTGLSCCPVFPCFPASSWLLAVLSSWRLKDVLIPHSGQVWAQGCLPGLRKASCHCSCGRLGVSIPQLGGCLFLGRAFECPRAADPEPSPYTEANKAGEEALRPSLLALSCMEFSKSRTLQTWFLWGDWLGAPFSKNSCCS